MLRGVQVLSLFLVCNLYQSITLPILLYCPLFQHLPHSSASISAPVSRRLHHTLPPKPKNLTQAPTGVMTRLCRYLTNTVPCQNASDSPSRSPKKDCGSGQKFFHFFLSSRRVRLNGPAPSLLEATRAPPSLLFGPEDAQPTRPPRPRSNHVSLIRSLFAPDVSTGTVPGLPKGT